MSGLEQIKTELIARGYTIDNAGDQASEYLRVLEPNIELDDIEIKVACDHIDSM